MSKRPQIFLIGLALAISYVDRQTLPVAIRAIQQDIPITNVQFSQLQAAFLATYAVAYVAGGRLADAVGVRWALAVMIAAWSAACAGQSLAAGFASLLAARAMLGLAEGGGFPAATKFASQSFGAAERAIAIGYIHAGTSLGSVVAPPLIAMLVTFLHWRWAFAGLGGVGAIWAAIWLIVSPSDSPAIIAGQRPAVPWLRLLAQRAVWGLFTARMLYDAAFYFYLFWLPKYLMDERGFDTRQVGYYAWIPFAAHGLGGLMAGRVSARLVRAGRPARIARLAVIGVSAVLMPTVFFVTQVRVELAIVLLSIAYFAQAATSAMMMVFPADLFETGIVGSVAGIAGVGGSLGGVVFGFVVGLLLDHGFGYQSVFALVSTFHLLGFVVIRGATRPVSARA